MQGNVYDDGAQGDARMANDGSDYGQPEVADLASHAMDAVGGAVGGLSEKVQNQWSRVKNYAGTLGERVAPAFSALKAKGSRFISNISNKMRGIKGRLGAGFKKLGAGFKNKVNKAKNGVKKAFSKAKNWLKKGFSRLKGIFG